MCRVPITSNWSRLNFACEFEGDTEDPTDAEYDAFFFDELGHPARDMTGSWRALSPNFSSIVSSESGAESLGITEEKRKQYAK